LTIDPEDEIDRITKFIRNYIRKSNSNGVVLGLSGGIDSAVVSFLATKALGKNNVTALLMFEDEFNNSLDYKDAMEVISRLGMRFLEIPIAPVVKSFQELLLSSGLKVSKVTAANMKARTRMVLLYAFANQEKRLVIGTGDRSEEMMGYFTKYGDGGVDFMPIAHLYKTQVRQIARKLGVPKSIIEKPSSPNLWIGHKASDELPLDYPSLDQVLSLIFDLGKNESETSKLTGIPSKTIRQVMNMYNQSVHKRKYPESMVC
jgi:NAD+ synthase